MVGKNCEKNSYQRDLIKISHADVELHYLDQGKEKVVNHRVAIILSLVVFGCGGGGSSGASSAVQSVTVDFRISKSETYQSDFVELTWSSSGGGTCSASGDWSGSKAASGSETVSTSESGDYSYTLTCSNGGNSNAQTVNLVLLEELQLAYEDFRVDLSEDETKEFDVGTATTNREPLTPLAYEVTNPPKRGTIVLSDGMAVYEPEADFSGEDVLEITVSSENQAAVASVAIIVSEINDPPSLDVQFPLAYSTEAGLLITSSDSLDFPYVIEDSDTPLKELSYSLELNGEVVQVEVREGVLRVPSIDELNAGSMTLNFVVSDGVSEATSSLKLWLGRTISETSGGARVNQILGRLGDPLRGFNYLLILDDIGPGEIRDSAYEAITFYLGGFLADFDKRRQDLIDSTFNVYVMDFPAGVSSGLDIKIGCYDDSPTTYCVSDALNKANDLVSGSSVLSAIDIGSISIITSLDGRGVNLGSVNVQPLTESTNGNFSGPNRLLRTLKHEFGHAFQELGDHYTTDFLKEDDDGNKLVDMSDAIQFLDSYSIDITLQEDTSLVKWRHHFVDKENIAGLHSFDSENSDSIGYWAGCYVHDQRCFRSSYESVMNGLSDYDDRISFDRDRQLSDYVKFDRVGAEGFALGVLQQQGINSIDVEIDQNGDLLVGHQVRLPSTLFAIDWYIDGVQVEVWADVSAVKLGGSELLNEEGEFLVERIKIPKKASGEYSSVAYRARELNSSPLILVKDEIDVFGDVYLGAFSRRSSHICDENNTSWAVVESTYCNSTLSIRFADGWHTSPDWSRKKELLEERGDDLYYFYEDSGLGSQFLINWRFYQ